MERLPSASITFEHLIRFQAVLLIYHKILTVELAGRLNKEKLQEQAIVEHLIDAMGRASQTPHKAGEPYLFLHTQEVQTLNNALAIELRLLKQRRATYSKNRQSPLRDSIQTEIQSLQELQTLTSYFKTTDD